MAAASGRLENKIKVAEQHIRDLENTIADIKAQMKANNLVARVAALEAKN